MSVYLIESEGNFIVNEKSEIIFMQTRLIRLASEEWQLPIDKVVEVFKKMNVFGYIEAGYGIFHCEGDEAVVEDIDEFLARKGIDVYKEEIAASKSGMD